MSERETERGETVSVGSFEFKTPDRPCRVVDCGEKADGVVDMEHSSIDVCINCAPQFLENDSGEWTPLAGGRSLCAERDRDD